MRSVGGRKHRATETSALRSPGSLHFPANRLRLGPRFLSRSKVTVLDLSKGKVVEGVGKVQLQVTANTVNRLLMPPSINLTNGRLERTAILSRRRRNPANPVR